MSYIKSDRYGGNYPEAGKLPLIHLGEECQFCGLQEAVEMHHYAYPDYPSVDEFHEDDLIALCKSCHELATIMRDLVTKKGATFDKLEDELGKCSTPMAKREAFSFWLHPPNRRRKKREEGAPPSCVGFIFGFVISVCIGVFTVESCAG